MSLILDKQEPLMNHNILHIPYPYTDMFATISVYRFVYIVVANFLECQTEFYGDC